MEQSRRYSGTYIRSDRGDTSSRMDESLRSAADSTQSPIQAREGYSWNATGGSDRAGAANASHGRYDAGSSSPASHHVSSEVVHLPTSVVTHAHDSHRSHLPATLRASHVHHAPPSHIHVSSDVDAAVAHSVSPIVTRVTHHGVSQCTEDAEDAAVTQVVNKVYGDFHASHSNAPTYTRLAHSHSPHSHWHSASGHGRHWHVDSGCSTSCDGATVVHGGVVRSAPAIRRRTVSLGSMGGGAVRVREGCCGSSAHECGSIGGRVRSGSVSLLQSPVTHDHHHHASVVHHGDVRRASCSPDGSTHVYERVTHTPPSIHSHTHIAAAPVVHADHHRYVDEHHGGAIVTHSVSPHVRTTVHHHDDHHVLHHGHGPVVAHAPVVHGAVHHLPAVAHHEAAHPHVVHHSVTPPVVRRVSTCSAAGAGSRSCTPAKCVTQVAHGPPPVVHHAHAHSPLHHYGVVHHGAPVHHGHLVHHSVSPARSICSTGECRSVCTTGECGVKSGGWDGWRMTGRRVSHSVCTSNDAGHCTEATAVPSYHTVPLRPHAVSHSPIHEVVHRGVRSRSVSHTPARVVRRESIPIATAVCEPMVHSVPLHHHIGAPVVHHAPHVVRRRSVSIPTLHVHVGAPHHHHVDHLHAGATEVVHIPLAGDTHTHVLPAHHHHEDVHHGHIVHHDAHVHSFPHSSVVEHRASASAGGVRSRSGDGVVVFRGSLSPGETRRLSASEL